MNNIAIFVVRHYNSYLTQGMMKKRNNNKQLNTKENNLKITLTSVYYKGKL